MELTESGHGAGDTNRRVANLATVVGKYTGTREGGSSLIILAPHIGASLRADLQATVNNLVFAQGRSPQVG
ncbi:hypothetical protein ES703_59289 [subsurface metagenome]